MIYSKKLFTYVIIQGDIPIISPDFDERGEE